MKACNNGFMAEAYRLSYTTRRFVCLYKMTLSFNIFINVLVTDVYTEVVPKWLLTYQSLATPNAAWSIMPYHAIRWRLTFSISFVFAYF